MTNPFKKIFFFLIYFIGFTGIGLWGYYQLKDTPFKREILLYDLTHIAQNCPKSPQKLLYQECLRPNILVLIDKATPIEILSIPKVLDSYYKQDQIQGKQYQQKAIKAFVINQVIFYEAIAKFTVSRNSLDFFQIVMLPVFRWQLENQLAKTKKRIKSEVDKIPSNELSPIEKRYFDKYLKLEISIP